MGLSEQANRESFRATACGTRLAPAGCGAILQNELPFVRGQPRDLPARHLSAFATVLSSTPSTLPIRTQLIPSARRRATSGAIR